jgi:hypothetical protein
MVDWKFNRRQGTCCACDRPFADGERHFSALSVSAGELAREDTCEACRKEPGGESDLFWWRTRHTVNKDRRLRLNLEALEALFISLEGKQEPGLRELRYVLCLLLMRKRRLKMRRIVRDESGESFLVNRPRRQEELRVFVFDFTPERMEELRDKLRRIFEGAETGLSAETEAVG